jgi:hypothetical protein
MKIFEAGSAGAHVNHSRVGRAKARPIGGFSCNPPTRVRVKSGTNAAPEALTTLADRFASQPLARCTIEVRLRHSTAAISGKRGQRRNGRDEAAVRLQAPCQHHPAT